MRKICIAVCMISLLVFLNKTVYAEETVSPEVNEEETETQENCGQVDVDMDSYEQDTESIPDDQESSENGDSVPDETIMEESEENLEQENSGSIDGPIDLDEENKSTGVDNIQEEEKLQTSPEDLEESDNTLDIGVEESEQSFPENTLPEMEELTPAILLMEETGEEPIESKEEAFVKEMYIILLERTADESGLNLYSGSLKNGTDSIGSLVMVITESKEFVNKNYSDQDYVKKLYQLLLGRSGGDEEVQNWTEMLDVGMSRRYILKAILNSEECTKHFQTYELPKGDVVLIENRDKSYNITAFVSRCYRYILERGADVSGLNTWSGKILSGAGGAEIVNELVSSQEFLSQNIDNGEFVELLYMAMLGRQADPQGKENWTGKLDKGVSYQYIINGFSGSEEFKITCSKYGIASGSIALTEARDKDVNVTGFVMRLYRSALNRKADVSGLNNWCDQLINRTLTPANAAYGFVFSGEAIEKNLDNDDFVEMLYRTCLGRNSDPAGKSNWISHLQNGTTREEVFWGFANSQEFLSIVAGYGLADSNYTGIGSTEDGLWYVVNGQIAYNFTGIITWSGAKYYVVNGKATLITDTFLINSCGAVSYDGSCLTVAVRADRNDALESVEGSLGIALMDSSGNTILGWSEGSVTKSGELTVSAEFSSNDSFRTEAMGKYAIAVKSGSSVIVISDSMYLSNPDIFASKEEAFKDRYMGYYEGYKITSKKGIQGVSMSYTEDLRVQHVLLNVDIADMVNTSPAAGYVSYVYKGQTYYFQDLIALKDTIYDLHGWGSTDGNAYGENHTRAVTLNLLLSWDDSLSYLIHPSARSKGAASYYALNMTEERARNTFEALFCYMGEELGQYKERVTNWTLGNEVNSCQDWNYSGSMSLEECVENYAEAFQLLYQGVKRTAGSSRIFISLDHCWTAADAGHSGKAYLDAFASYMNKTAPSMQWNVNYHPYSQPLSRNDFWNDYSNTTDATDTRYISMQNIQVLTDYLGTLETQYGKESGSIRVIIGELGFSAAGGNSGQENQQAAALGYGYYKAMFNTRIDAYIIRAYLDDPAEISTGLHLGLRRNDGSQTAKISYDVYQNLDTDQSLNYMNQYLGLIGIGSWESVIGGFDASKLPAGDF